MGKEEVKKKFDETYVKWTDLDYTNGNIKRQNKHSDFKMNNDEFLKQFLEIQKLSYDLVKSKNNDYGNSFVTDGYEGVIIRMTDKMNRIRTLSDGTKKEVNNESLRDTIIDLQNYCGIAIICLNSNLHSLLFKEK
jgi:hypothetical protein